MATSFDKQLNELEAQFRAGVEKKSAEAMRGSNGTASPAPRRSRPCKCSILSLRGRQAVDRSRYKC